MVTLPDEFISTIFTITGKNILQATCGPQAICCAGLPYSIILNLHLARILMKY
jgi:hypothetical protein